jgi:hypothetical protein
MPRLGAIENAFILRTDAERRRREAATPDVLPSPGDRKPR